MDCEVGVLFHAPQKQSPDNYILTRDKTIDLYFTLLNGYTLVILKMVTASPSKESIDGAWDYFLQFNAIDKENKFREILSKSREKGIKTKI